MPARSVHGCKTFQMTWPDGPAALEAWQTYSIDSLQDTMQCIHNQRQSLAVNMHVRANASVIPGCQSLQGHWHWTQLQAGGSPPGQPRAGALGPVQDCRRAAPSPAPSPASGTAPLASVFSLLTPASSSAPYRHWHCR